MTGRLFLSSVFERAKELNLKPSERLVLTALFKYLGKNDFCWPTQRMVAEDTGLKVRQIRNLMKKLVSAGIIERDKRRNTGRASGNNAYEYRFVFPQSDQTKGAINCPFDETKAAISDQTKAAICDTPKRQSITPKAAICDTQSGNLRHSKVPQKQASRRRAGAEYINNRSKNKSINQSGKNDGLTEEEILDTKPASEEVDPLADNEEAVLDMKPENENFVPPPGAPSRLSPEQVKAIFRGPGPRPVDILDCPEGEFDLSRLVAPFKGLPEVFEIIRFNPGISQVEWFEKALKEFYRKVIDRHWSKKASPPGTPFRNLFFKAGRSGLLYDFGFRPLSPEQVEARQREVERQEAQEQEDTRLREEESRRQAEKDAALRKFISLPTVRDYLDFKGVPRKLGAIREHLREIAARLNGLATPIAVEEFMREELRKEGY